MICYVDRPHPFTTTAHFIRLRPRAGSNGNAAVVQGLCLVFRAAETVCTSLWNTHAVLLQLADCGPASGLASADQCRTDQVCGPEMKGRRLEKQTEKKKKLDAGFTSLLGACDWPVQQKDRWTVVRLRPDALRESDRWKCQCVISELSVARSRQRLSDLIAIKSYGLFESKACLLTAANVNYKIEFAKRFIFE